MWCWWSFVSLSWLFFCRCSLSWERRRISVGDVVRVAESIKNEEEKQTPHSDLGQRIVAPVVATLQEELMQRLDSVSIEDLCQRARHVGMDADAEASADFTIRVWRNREWNRASPAAAASMTP